MLGRVVPYRNGRDAAARHRAEADGNRTRLTEILGHYGFEDRGEHQLPKRLLGPLTCANTDLQTQGGRFREEQYRKLGHATTTAGRQPSWRRDRWPA
jgi:hypothetical protein